MPLESAPYNPEQNITSFETRESSEEYPELIYTLHGVSFRVKMDIPANRLAIELENIENDIDQSDTERYQATIEKVADREFDTRRLRYSEYFS